MPDVIEVWIARLTGDVRVGSLYPSHRGGRESAAFRYDESYLVSPDAFAIDPALPLDTATSHAPTSKRLFNAFSDASPDRWGRGLVQRHEHLMAKREGRHHRYLTEVGFLLGVRDDLRQGALRFRSESGGPFRESSEHGVPALVDLPQLLSAAEAVGLGDYNAEVLAVLLEHGSSLGGARPKAHVRSSDGLLAIAKFPSASMDIWDVPAWEGVALDLARSAGLAASRSQVIEVADRHVLIVDRFDRTPEGVRIPYASALTMLEADDGEASSYLDIAAVIEEMSLSATQELAELWARIAFSGLISNTDDHLRNHGFLRIGSSWRLSPLFDVNPTPNRRHLSTTLDGDETVASVETLMSIAPFFRLDGSQAARKLQEIRAVTATWRHVARTFGISAVSSARMEPAFENSFSVEIDSM